MSGMTMCWRVSVTGRIRANGRVLGKQKLPYSGLNRGSRLNLYIYYITGIIYTYNLCRREIVGEAREDDAVRPREDNAVRPREDDTKEKYSKK